VSLGAGAQAQEPVAGQHYAIPPGFEGSSAGSLISYGGYDYVTQDNGTMLLSASQDAAGSDNVVPFDDSVSVDTTAYKLPAGYEDSQPGSQVSSAGNDYTVMAGGTMMMTNPAYSISDSTQYKIPSDYAGSDAGSVISYGGSDYLVRAGVMVRININAGYGTKAIAGTPASKLTSSGTKQATQGHGQQQRLPNSVIGPHQGQQQRWPSQVVQQQRRPNQVPQQHINSQGYSRVFSRGPSPRRR
jgi:hypothetical protein